MIAAATACDKNVIPAGETTTPIGINVSTADTRGSVLTTENIASKLGEFVCDIWLESDDYEGLSGYMPTIPPTSQHYVDKATVKYSDGQWKFTGAKQPTWVHDIQSQFWAWAPKEVSGRSITTAPAANAGSMKFTYAVPATAAAQKDLVFAYAEKTFDAEASSPDATINIEFKHALSEIRFMTEAVSAADIAISAIEIRGIAASGSFEFKKDGSFSCTAGSTGSCSQSDVFSGASESGSGAAKTYTTANNFFLIPQALPENSKLIVTFSDSQTLSADLKAVKSTWEAGKYYTYKIVRNKNAMTLNVTLVDWASGNDPDNPDDTTIQYPVLD